LGNNPRLAAGQGLGPNGFIAHFMQSVWPIIHADLMAAFNAFLCLDMRGFQSAIEALMVLLPKSSQASSMSDYRPISLIHLIGKLFSKVLANSLAPKLDDVVHPSQGAFFKGRLIHNSFHYVQGSAKMLHARRIPSLFVKVDITQAFDSVAWPFLLEILAHLVFPTVRLNYLSTLLTTASTKDVEVKYLGYCGSPVTDQTSEYDRFPPAAKQLGRHTPHIRYDPTTPS
jgi:hypothetical protein